MTKKTWLILPDLHFPFHCPLYLKVVTLVIKLLRAELNGIVQLGDFVDCWQLSVFDKDPARKNNVIQDIEQYGKWLDQIDALVKRETKFYQLEGNHEDRLRRYAWAKAPDLVGMVRDIPEILSFKDRNKHSNMTYRWFPISDWDACQIGDVVLHHGHFFNKHVAVNNLAIYETKFISGHTHRFQFAANGDRWSVSLGYGSTEPAIGHKPVPHGWQQVFAILTVVDGKGWLEPFLVNKGVCNFRGKMLYA